MRQRSYLPHPDYLPQLGVCVLGKLFNRQFESIKSNVTFLSFLFQIWKLLLLRIPFQQFLQIINLELLTPHFENCLLPAYHLYMNKSCVRELSQLRLEPVLLGLGLMQWVLS